MKEFWTTIQLVFAGIGGWHHLNGHPEFFHVVCPPLKLKMSMKKVTPERHTFPIA